MLRNIIESENHTNAHVYKFYFLRGFLQYEIIRFASIIKPTNDVNFVQKGKTCSKYNII
jgi:hypothetical protein